MLGMGKGNAASVTSSFRSSFGGIKLALVVGICGGMPIRTDGKEIILGDVIINTGIIQSDFGKRLPDRFIRKTTPDDNISRPNAETRGFLSKMGGLRGPKRLAENTFAYLQELYKKGGFQKARFPGAAEDKLYKQTYCYKHYDLPSCTICMECENKGDMVCDVALDSLCLELKCNENELVQRQRLLSTSPSSSFSNFHSSIYECAAADEQKPSIHFGLIASGDAGITSGEDRDEIAAREKVIGFEMEGAEVWVNFPCVVIRGVCDYADSHKSKNWQGYTAACAAACMKAFLKDWIPTKPSPDAGDDTHTQITDSISRLALRPSLRIPYFSGPLLRNVGFFARDNEINFCIDILLGVSRCMALAVWEKHSLHSSSLMSRKMVSRSCCGFLQRVAPN